MGRITRSILLIGILMANMPFSFADRGIGRKNRVKINLNIPVNTSLRNALVFNMKAGLKYTGSLVTSCSNQKSLFSSSNIVTYKMGPNVYIVPYKQKIIVPEIKQGYTGMKLIIKP